MKFYQNFGKTSVKFQYHFHSGMINEEKYSWQNPLRARVKGKPLAEPRRAKPKTNHQAPIHSLKLYEEAVMESEARTTAVQLKSEK